MARLNDENLHHAEDQASDQILSPQPCAPPSKELLAASLEPTHVAKDSGSTIDDGQMSTQSYEYSSSPSSTRHSTSDIFRHEMDDELEQMKSRASSRSSFSSVPASVLIHPLDHMKQIPAMGIHEQIVGYSIEDEEASFGGFDRSPPSIRTIRQREAAFRKPSSVRAMQMHTEDEADDDEFLTPPRRRPGMRSQGTSPLKRSPYYSPKTAQAKPSVKKEYPLVLLHCTLLAPSLPVPGAAEPQNQKVVEEVLPPQYWKRWRRLRDKVGSGVLRDRGVLISHPEDLYDILEERLLESLELQRPLLHRGHFLGHEEPDPGSEGEVSDRGESETDGEQGNECPDCGGRVMHHTDTNRKWEIRVYAANGLMRAGAWAAAWKEMEKVDVEVGVWLPSEVRRALEKRLAEEQAVVSLEHGHPTAVFNDTEKLEMDPRRLSVQTHSRIFSNAGSLQSSGHTTEPQQHEKRLDLPQVNPQHEIALQTLVFNYIRVLARDRRNIALVFLSILVGFLAFGSRPQKHQLQDVLYSFTHEDLPGTPAVWKPTVHADVLASSVPSSSATSIESMTPTSSMLASMPVSDIVASSPVREVIPSPVSPAFTNIEIMSVDSEPTVEPEPQEEVPEQYPEELQHKPTTEAAPLDDIQEEHPQELRPELTPEALQLVDLLEESAEESQRASIETCEEVDSDGPDLVASVEECDEAEPEVPPNTED